jgi:DNA-binding ferritin-like protein
MKKLSFLAVAFTAMIFASCGGNKNANTAEQEAIEKSFEQEQIEEAIKMNLDSLASELGKLKQLPFLTEGADGKLALTKEEKQVKPDYLLAPAVADEATTLSEKYRVLSALNVDRKTASLYEMPTEDYDKAIAQLSAEINDPSLKAVEDATTLFETSQVLYDSMNENGRINFFWQLAAAALVEQLYITNQNADKFLSIFDDDAASNVTFRIILVIDAVKRLAEYDEDFKPVAEAIEPLTVLNAISVDEFKSQLAEAKEEIDAARAALIK